MRLTESICYNLALAFLGPLKRLGSRTPSITRFNSNEEYFAQRVADTSHYQKLFEPFVKFEGKTVLDLGCNRGYLLHSFLQHENFTAIGGDLVSYYLNDARRNYGDQIQFVETTPTHIPLPDNSVDVVYTIDTVEHLSEPRENFKTSFACLSQAVFFWSTSTHGSIRTGIILRTS